MWTDKKGFLATLLGGTVGGGVGLYLGAIVGWAADLGDGLESLGYVLVFAAAGAWLGCLAGAYVALRLVKADPIGGTIRWLAVLAPLLVGGGTWVAVSRTDSDDFGSNFIPYLLFVASVLATAYLARRAARGARS